MSKAHPSALELAIAQADEKHEAAQKALALARNRLRNSQATYATLDNFRGDYANRLRAVTHAAKDTLGNYHRFIGKLEQALHSQQQDVARADQAVEQSEHTWSAARRRLKAMELLRDRRAAAAQAREKRLEQKQSDEYAARSTRRLHRHD